MFDLRTLVSAICLTGAGATAWADPNHGDNPTFGRPGEDHHVTRDVEVRMGEMYFAPESIDVKPGETIRFKVINEGEAVHEFNLGTAKSWESHTAEMQRMMDEGMIDFDKVDHGKMLNMGMMHNDPNSVLLEPGETAEIIWSFPEKATEVGFGCNVPGHLESGMKGEIAFEVEG